MEKILEVLERFAKLFRANKLLIVTVAIAWWGSWGWLLFIAETREWKAYREGKEVQVKVATDATIQALRQTIEVQQNQLIRQAAADKTPAK